ncbi:MULTISPECIES: aminopeptidase N [unclassified Colwellia]|uniref:aminopeptidase N n=1 Tax=unclassified Colwellia TaxID=196834 RepID=UPI0015F72C3A|nr:MULTISPECIES: aminopeptidase N [unclassified Colwellia]MBA6349024.1 aminopeptidase N [Colwellia sp. BRX8-9]MBA6354999.1 aminopeptidase N [Colwellia sp. BRX8-3]MBA6359886.1 aminopeptidase N [Colwellia sp. BRX8-6]MBA6366901.1 aminopeptidase N [Colwellia sp. BRX8-5]MBA6371725.1 aminopeptidase N [Colwellia sp. BRX8-4]
MTDFTARYLSDYQVSNFSITTVDLTFELADTATIVTSTMAIKRENKEAKQLVLDGEQLKLISLQIDHQDLPESYYQVSDTQLTLDISADEFTLTIVTEIDPLNNTSLEGLFKSGGAFCTQCEAEGFRRITYYLDRPDVMSTFSTKVIADKKRYPYLLSNGNKTAAGDLPQGKHFTCWHDPHPKPCYLFALVAGDFDLLVDTFTTQDKRDVAIEIFVDKGNLPKAHHAMASLKKSMLWDEETFGLVYDLDIYMIVAVDFFNMGAMENKGLNVFNSKFVLADNESATDTDFFNIEAVIGHEYFHNWTGNRVTCRDWFQLSLKEGLTVFRDQQFSADMHSAAVNRIKNVRLLRSKQFAEDAGPMAHPIRPEKVLEMNNFYTLTVYEKGAEVIRMINTLLGEVKFRKGMDLYFARFDGMAVTCDDFINAMSDASGVDLDLFKGWYYQSGTPTLSVNEIFSKGQYQLTLTQKNPNQKDGSEGKALHIPVAIELIENNKVIGRELLELTTEQQTWTFDNLAVKPVLAILADFSAPVKLTIKQTDKELATIMAFADDEFCRWDAGQQLMLNYIKALVDDSSFVLPQSLLTTYQAIFDANTDNSFKAEQLSLPSFDEVVAEIAQVDPIKVVNAIAAVKLFLVTGLTASFEKAFTANKSFAYKYDGEEVGQRALKNVCLSYLSLLEHQKSKVVEQYQSSDNMTDTLAALVCSAENNSADLAGQLQHFEKKWQSTALVMDKWFSLAAQQCSEDIFTSLGNLLTHPLFSLKNPNRARSLVGSFSVNNPRYFHCQSGQGYQFLAEQIALLNEINPQVASRLITPLIQFRSFDLSRQELMRAELEKLTTLKNLSKDLKEKLDAALAS